jgi:hypothetical protein
MSQTSCEYQFRPWATKYHHQAMQNTLGRNLWQVHMHTILVLQHLSRINAPLTKSYNDHLQKNIVHQTERLCIHYSLFLYKLVE